MEKEYTEAEVRLIIEGAIAAEREACIKAIRDVDDYQSPAYPECIEVIRARGQHE
jgi:hypothetical protein